MREHLREIPNFPTEGINFIDITPILQNPELFKQAVDELITLASKYDFDVIAATESRGFLFGSAMAYVMGKGLVPVRKKGKLPYDTVECEYALEYGTATIEIHTDAVKQGQKVLLVDDLLATGGTTKATAELVEKIGGEVAAIIYLVELEFLNGRDKLSKYNISALIGI